ncbi:hemicentin-1-like [Mytilus galloprovincialis]|uniref:hemicentin-1-like n=1 Tax=Mytilus galloprovincialis TaxID=29158 RepID=UPI003F7BFB8F
MEFIHILLIFCLGFLSFFLLAAGALDPPRDIRTSVFGNDVHISWTVTPIQGETFSRISLFDSRRKIVAIDSSNNYTDVKFPITEYKIVNLTKCLDYIVKIEYPGRGLRSGVTEKRFWMTENIIFADINENVTISWTTGIKEFFSVMSPSSSVIYETDIDSIIDNSQMVNYKFDTRTNDLKAINITVINVNSKDGGLYRAVKSEIVDGCALLVVKGKPIKPTLTLQPEHPFVGDDITITCSSTVQRWPAGFKTSNLRYAFDGNFRGVIKNNTVTTHTLTKADNGTYIHCQATDDLGIISNMSNTVTLDPYYGPNQIVLEPANTVLKVLEGTTLGPIQCTATCYPGCKYNWTQNWSGQYTPVPSEFISNQNQNITVPNIQRNQSGAYLCKVDHSEAKRRQGNELNISVDVQYGPEDVVLQPKITVINILEGTTLGPINCTATCNPRCKYDWKQNLTGHFRPVPAEFISNQNQTLTIPGIKRAQTGTFSCRVDHSESKRHNSTNFSVNVQYGPDNVKLVPNNQIINVIEGSTLGPLYCTATCNPGCIYNWKQNWTERFRPVPEEFISNKNQTLTVPVMKRNQTGEYSCHAGNTKSKRHETTFISVNVLYGPEDVVLKPNNTIIYIQEGFTLGPVNCKAICNPGCIYNWNQNWTGRYQPVPEKFISNQNQTLTIQGIMGNQSGAYSCHVDHYDSKRQMRIELLVNVKRRQTNAKYSLIMLLSIGLGGCVLVLLVVIVVVVSFNRRNRGNISDREGTNRSAPAGVFTDLQRGNSAFANDYSGLQSFTASVPVQDHSTFGYASDDCGKTAGDDGYIDIEDTRKNALISPQDHSSTLSHAYDVFASEADDNGYIDFTDNKGNGQEYITMNQTVYTNM